MTTINDGDKERKYEKDGLIKRLTIRFSRCNARALLLVFNKWPNASVDAEAGAVSFLKKKM
jgi:hypothetical protein